MRAYALWIIRYRLWVIAATLVFSAVMVAYCAKLQVVINPNEAVPQDNPYIKASKRIVKVFGSEYPLLIGITPKHGDIFQPAVLDRVKQITAALERTPGVVGTTLLSLDARTVKDIRGDADGFEVHPLMSSVPSTPAQMAKLKAALLANPIYLDTIVSKDFRTAAIWVEVKENDAGFGAMIAPVKAAIAAAAGPDVSIALAGDPVYLAKSEELANRIVYLFPLSFLIIGLLHYEAFRTKQGFILPLVTAALAALWGTGLMGLMQRPLDAFNSPTPILILGVAAGHAVQLLKRYYEEYAVLRREAALTPREANSEAVVRSLTGVGPVMTIAGVVAALGFFSLLTFDIATIRTFGLFTGCGILCAVLLEMTFIPAVRSLLPPPSAGEQQREGVLRWWDRIPRAIGTWITQPRDRRRLLLGIVALWVGMGLCATRVIVDNSNRNLFASWLEVRQDDAFLNRHTAGTNALYIMVEGRHDDAIKNPRVLAGIADIQRFAESQPYVGKTLSIADFIEHMNKAMHGGDARFDRVPDTRNLISQYLLLYAMSGEPGDFDSYIDYNYRAAKIVILLKTGSNAYIGQLIDRIRARAATLFGDDVTLSFGGDAAASVALTDTMVHGKLLNIVQICLAIFAISSLVFRSVWAGVIVLMPLLLAVSAEFAVMGLTGIPLNIPNSLIAAMAVGIGADYAIYLLYRIREQAALGASPEAAVRAALATAGKACLLVATAVASGYGVAAFSIGYNVHLWFAIFTATMMLVSALGSLIMVPGLALVLRPAFVFAPAPRRRWALSTAMVVLAVAAYAMPLLAHADASNAPADTPSAHADTVNARDIMEKNYAATRVHDVVEKSTFTLTNDTGDKRVRRAISYNKLQANGVDYMHVVRFLSPPDIAGTATLLIEHTGGEDDMWVYLPALRKNRRLSTDNKKDSFIGTDFSYADVLGYKVDDWHYQMVKEDVVDGASCYVIEALPKDDAVKEESAYSKRLVWIRKDNFVAVRQEFWDLSGEPFKLITAGAFQAVANGKWQPLELRAEHLQSGHKTDIRFSDMKVDEGLGDQYFTPRFLEN